MVGQYLTVFGVFHQVTRRCGRSNVLTRTNLSREWAELRLHRSFCLRFLFLCWPHYHGLRIKRLALSLCVYFTQCHSYQARSINSPVRRTCSECRPHNSYPLRCYSYRTAAQSTHHRLVSSPPIVCRRTASTPCRHSHEFRSRAEKCAIAENVKYVYVGTRHNIHWLVERLQIM